MEVYSFCIIWCIFCSTFTSATNSSGDHPDGKIPLYFAYITTFTGGFIASGGIPIVDMALQQINSRDDILQNYTLGYTEILNSGVSINKNTINFMLFYMYLLVYA